MNEVSPEVKSLEDKKRELIEKYGKPIRKIYTDEELKPYTKPLRSYEKK